MSSVSSQRIRFKSLPFSILIHVTVYTSSLECAVCGGQYLSAVMSWIILVSGEIVILLKFFMYIPYRAGKAVLLSTKRAELSGVEGVERNE